MSSQIHSERAGVNYFLLGFFLGIKRTCPGTHIPQCTDAHDFFTPGFSAVHFVMLTIYTFYSPINHTFRSASSHPLPSPSLSFSLLPLSLSLSPTSITYSSLPLWRVEQGLWIFSPISSNRHLPKMRMGYLLSFGNRMTASGHPKTQLDNQTTCCCAWIISLILPWF